MSSLPHTTSHTSSSTLSASSTSTSAVSTADHSRSLLAAGLTLGIIGAIAIAIIIRWTYHLNVPNGPVTLKDMEEGEAANNTKHKRRGPSISGAVALGGGLVRKATGKLLHSGNSPSANSRRQLAAKITPFGSSPTQEEDKPKFVHIPGQNMRIATRLPDGAWSFSEPDVRTNRRSMSAASWFGVTGGNGRTSAYGLGGYNGIQPTEVEQVSPTESSFFHHKPRYAGGESSLSVNTHGLASEKDDYAYSSVGGHSPVVREGHDLVSPLPTAYSDRRQHPRLSIPMSAYSPPTSPTTSSNNHAPSLPPFTLSAMSPTQQDSPLYGDFPMSVDGHSQGHGYNYGTSQNRRSKPILSEIRISNPFEVPFVPSPTAQQSPPLPPPKTPLSKSFNFLDHTETASAKEKEMEATYGFSRVELPPPAYDREKERERERKWER